MGCPPNFLAMYDKSLESRIDERTMTPVTQSMHSREMHKFLPLPIEMFELCALILCAQLLMFEKL